MKHRLTQFTAVLVASLTLGACGGGGGDSSTPSTPTAAPSVNILSGTAATGSPINNGQVTITDSAGKALVTPVDSNGNYSVDVTALKAPLIVNATGTSPSGTPISLYSAAATISSATNANVTPLTNAVLTVATGTSPDNLLQSADFSKITTSTLSNANQAVTGSVSNLIASTSTSTSVDLIRTSFTANKTGHDLLLESLDVKTVPAVSGSSTPSVSVTSKVSNGTAIITTPVGGIAAGNPTIAGSISAPAAGFSSIQFSGIDTLFSSTNKIIQSTASSSTKATNLQALIDTSFLDNGQSGATWTQNLASASSSTTLSNGSVVSCDLSSRIICQVRALQTAGSQMSNFVSSLIWDGSAWKYYGNQRITSIGVVPTVFNQVTFTDTTIARSAYAGYEVYISTEGGGANVVAANVYMNVSGTWQLISAITGPSGTKGTNSFLYSEVQLADSLIDSLTTYALTNGIYVKVDLLNSSNAIVSTNYINGLGLPLKSNSASNINFPKITDAGINQFRQYQGGSTLQLSLSPSTGTFSPKEIFWIQTAVSGQSIASTDLALTSSVVNIQFASTVSIASNKNRGIDFYGYDFQGRRLHTKNTGCNAPSCI